MPNLLAMPFKRTEPIDIKEAARNYLYNHGGVHPDEFKADILRWQSLRKDIVGEIVHTDRIRALLLYHAQLVSILAKLPADINLAIPYTSAFSSSRIILTNLVFERASVLFNLAALFSRLAASEDRSTRDGIKRAKNNYEQAAGALLYLLTSVLPKLTYSPDDEVPLDLSPALVEALEWLMLAQAQECAWQAAKLESHFKNMIIARIASKASSLYRSVSVTLQDAIPNVKRVLPPEWISHVRAKEHHFQAVAQYRKSMDDIEASRYGLEIARLDQARIEAQQGKSFAERNGVALPVLQDLQSLLDVVEMDLTRARRDNDLIYHHDIPTLSSLPPIPDAALATPAIPPGLANPSTILGSQPVLFEELLGWGAREAIHIYNDRKNNLVYDRIVDGARELKDNADEVLRSLNLPAALEALERPIGLPPSLLRKAEEVRLESGPTKIEASIEDVQRLAHHDLAILDEAMDILDHEASEDEAARKDKPINRPPSHQANAELVEKEKRYRNVLEQAASSDEIVRQKWDEWERNIVELTWSEAELEASVPSTAIKSTAQLTAEGVQTQSHARALRVLLESLDTLRQAGDRVVTRAATLSKSDDISARILRVSSGFERLTEVQPAMFEDVMDEELAKYDKFLNDLSESGRKQADILLEVKSRNELFLQSRRDDPSLKEREHALQSLDLAYLKYREITRNLEEGFKFYNDLAGILIQFKEGCKNWSHHRHQEIHSLSRSLKALTLSDESESPGAKKISANARAPISPPPRNKPPTGKSTLGLPAITSSDWEFEEVPLPPGPPGRN